MYNAQQKWHINVTLYLPKAYGYVPYLIVQIILQIKTKMSEDGTTTYAEHYVRWGIIAHIVHNGVILRFSDVNTQQSEQFQIKIRHAKFQCKLLKPPKNPSDVS